MEKLRDLPSERILEVVRDRLEQWPNHVEYLDDVLGDFGL